MISYDEICINRKAAPGLDLKDFIKMVSELGIKNIELRNDITGKVDNSTILDEYSPEEIKKLLDKYNITVVDINAQGNMDDASKLDNNLKSLQEMIDIGKNLMSKISYSARFVIKMIIDQINKNAKKLLPICVFIQRS